jgi:hypothetical protein
MDRVDGTGLESYADYSRSVSDGAQLEIDRTLSPALPPAGEGVRR